MEHRRRTRRRADQVRAGPHRAPRDCALGMRALHTQPRGWAAFLARGTPPVSQCQGPQSSLLQQLLPLLSPNALPCGQAALQPSCTRSCELYRSSRSPLRGSGVLRLLNCCAVAHVVVCNGMLCIRWQSAAAIWAASPVQSAVSVAFSPHVALAAHGCRCPPSTP